MQDEPPPSTSTQTMPPFPTPHIIQPSATHTHTIIFLHGRGSTGPEFCSDLHESLTPSGQTLSAALPHWKWIFPSARPTYDPIFKMDLSEWFKVTSLTNPAEKEELQIPGLRHAIEMLCGLIRVEGALLGDPKRVVLAGLSQGMATAVTTLLTARPALGAFVGMAGWTPLLKTVLEALDRGEGGVAVACQGALGMDLGQDGSRGSLRDLPVFLGHGRDDGIVNVQLGEQTRDVLQRLGARVEWREYKGAELEGHWLKDSEEFGDLVDFLDRVAKEVV